MASYEKAMPLGGPLPKFGDWDVNDPASAEGFTVIFNKARDDRRSGAGTPLILAAPDKYDARKKKDKYKYPKKVSVDAKKWFRDFEGQLSNFMPSVSWMPR